MPANVDSMFSVREVPWHKEGVVLGDYPGSWAEARKAAGLDWEPIEEKQYRLVGVDTDGREIFKPVDEYKYIVRSDTSAILDSANGSYPLITHAEMGEVVEKLLQSDDVKYETAGALDGGKRVWALAQLGDLVELEGDRSPYRRLIAAMNAHDGTSALKVIQTTVRVVCANTWHLAELQAEKNNVAYSFRHTKHWKKQVEEAREAVVRAYAQADKYTELARKLLKVRVTSEQVQEFVDNYAVERAILNTDVKRSNLEEHLTTNPRVAESMAHAKVTLKQILKSETCDGIETTAYGLLQAGGEFADHFRDARSADTLFTRTVINVEPLKKVSMRLLKPLLVNA